MHNFATFFIWALSACILRKGSFAKGQSGYICLIDDPKQNHCDSICLNELSPRLSEVIQAQNQGNTNTRDAVNEIKSKMDRLEAKMEGQLQKVEAKLEGQLQEVQTKLQGQQTKMEAKLEDTLLAVLTKMDDSQAKLKESFLAVKTKLENQLQGVENQLQAMSNKIDAAKVEIPDFVRIAPSGFERIGNRYFRIVKEEEDWVTAERRCREMGGYLASFRNEEEIKAIQPKLYYYPFYWLGINDRENEGHFVSVASHKPATFLKWRKGKPNDRNHEANCVVMYFGQMEDFNCNSPEYFICQADNET